MEKIFAIIGIFVFAALGYAMSNNKKDINWKSVGIAFIGQIALTFLMIKTPLWKVIEWIAAGFQWFINQSTEGINFVFGGIVPEGGYVFFINSLLPIVFISAVTGLLFHFGILQRIIGLCSKTVAKLFKIDSLVAVNAVTNMFLGQSDALIVTKSYLPNASESVVFATLVAGMSSISISVLQLYVGFGASLEWLIASIPLTVLSTFVMIQLMMPTTNSEETVVVVEGDKGSNAIDTMMIYANAGFKAVIGVSIALMVFLSLVHMANNLLGLASAQLTLQKIVGILFYPLSLLMGVPTNELGLVSELLATKLIANESVAFGLSSFNTLSEATKAMVTVAIAGFANISSIGIMLGGYSAIAPGQMKTVAKLGIKSLVAATIVNLMSGAVIALFV